jgi:hypothetical protein
MSPVEPPRLILLLPLFAVFAATSVWLAAAGLPIARGDDAFYKAPGAELAATGKFASPSVKGYLPKVEEIYAAYPPLYSWVFAGWVKLFGFSLTSATAFNHTIHLLGTAALAWAVSALLRPLKLSANWKSYIVASVAIIHFGNLRFFDRQEELAMIFVWLEATVACRFAKVCFESNVDDGGRRTFAERKATVVTGLCVGLAIMVGPWPGMLAAGSVGLRMILEAIAERRIPWTAWITTVVVAALPLGLCLAWMEWHYPGLVALQFREHVGRVPRVLGWEHPDVWTKSWTYAPYQLPFVLVGAMLLRGALVAFRARESVLSSAVRRAALATTIISLAAILVGGCWRADSYVYLWAALMLLFPYFGFAVGSAIEKASSKERLLLAAMTIAATIVALRDPVTLAINAGEFPPEDRPAAMFAHLHERIPPSDVVATTPRFWHAFQNRNPWRQTSALPWISETERKTWDWIVLPLGHGDESFRKKLLEGFDLAERREASFLPWRPTFAPDERTWEFELYRRR